MGQSIPYRLSVALAAGAAASALAAAPALATEGPAAGPPAAALPTDVAPVTFAPLPSVAPPTVRSRNARVVRRARLTPRRVRRGRKPLLNVSLTTPSRLRIVISRSTGRGRSRAAALSVPARGRTISLRLPARSKGHDLRPGRYRVSIVAIDAQGTRSRQVRRTLIVRRAARR